MEKITKCLLLLAILLLGNPGIGKGGRNVPNEEDENVYSPQGLHEYLRWLKHWWLFPWWAIPVQPFLPYGDLNKAPEAKYGWTNYDVDLLAKEYNYMLGNIPKVDRGDGSSP